MKLDRYCRPYAIVRCLQMCTLVHRGQESPEIDGTDVEALRRLIRDHAMSTGHEVEYDLTLQQRYAPAGSNPSWAALPATSPEKGE